MSDSRSLGIRSLQMTLDPPSTRDAQGSAAARGRLADIALGTLRADARRPASAGGPAAARGAVGDSSSPAALLPFLPLLERPSTLCSVRVIRNPYKALDWIPPQCWGGGGGALVV